MMTAFSYRITNHIIERIVFKIIEGAGLTNQQASNTRHNTFKDIQERWLKDFKKYVKKEGTYVLIGNKIDLEDQRTVPKEEGSNLAEKIQASDFIETSANLNQNVNLAFKNLVYQILRNHGEEI